MTDYGPISVMIDDNHNEQSQVEFEIDGLASQHLNIGTETTLLSSSEISNDSVEMDHCPQLQDLPEEILEKILSYLSRYKDHDCAKLVCHQWCRVIKSLIKHSKRHFYHRLSSCKAGWTEVVQGSRNAASQNSNFRHVYAPVISERFSHSCAYLNGSMYVFGGCTSTNTTFNDLWRLDTTTRCWMRPPVAMGSYPSPKACASMVIYQGKLVLFGGWSHPIPYPLHQSANYFSELHTYDPVTNHWCLLQTLGPEPDALGGHSASIIQNRMVIFGGSPRPGQGSNKLWVYDFEKSYWSHPKVEPGVVPEPRYGQYQCTLDESHILIMGGCGGPSKIYSDFYILTVMPDDAWLWTKLHVQHPEFAPKQTWCHAVCRVEDKLVVLCKSSKVRECLNVKPRIFQVESPSTPKNPPTENRATSSLPSLPQPQDQQESLEKCNTIVQTKSEKSASDYSLSDGAAPSELSLPTQASNNRNLLALQQRLHREYVNLPDQDNHQHNPNADNNIPEGQILRLQNRANQHADGSHNQHDQIHHHKRAPVQELNQPHAGQFRRISHPSGRDGLPLPSIRPNANSNRQKQLEALQRQEELLRSKSKARAAARKKSSTDSLSECTMSVDEEVPPIVPVKNRMDMHVVDISLVLTTGEVEWKPESPLQPPGAPMETLCCSLVEGRAELILFGGVGRETTIPMVQNTALNKLFILHA